MDAKGQNTATLADKLGRPRAEVRRILTGAEPLLVDDLLRITEILGLTATELGLSGADAVEDVPEDAPNADSDHWTNQTRLLFETGFRAGIDFAFTVAADQLGDWGGPEHVRKQHAGRELVIQLDSAYHRYMQPRYDEAGVALKIGFDGLYDCYFTWGAIRRVFFTPVPPEVAAPAPEPPAPPSEPTEPGPKGRPTLRLVK